MTIQWFPGHMAKARREITEKLKLIDVVFELVDARVPLASRNPMIDEITAGKPRLLLLNKADMADPEVTRLWVEYFQGKGLPVLVLNSKTGQGINKIEAAAKELVKEKFDKMKAKGIIKPRAVRALILGIPNVGKSTLINRMAGKNIAVTGDKPGVTKKQQWIKVGSSLELLDTPGILWPKFEDQSIGLKLAVTGAIKETLLDFSEIVLFALNYYKDHYPERLQERYNLEDIPDEAIQLFDAIGKKRGCLMSGGFIDYEKTAEIVLRDIRAEKLGRLSYERPDQV
ncbi:ribosome biogenesis GTPase YlqF [Fictibacillus enclensis]|uniref:Ribosome biogenesis GTPase A n=1 Tax=Fictibacillus enclensis TaxID=1017270 RepID=A0A0V8JDM8_9BACL|nr:MULTISPECIES: ribosome biogenesis GTPase YlqF [Fictibacillus]KSU85053.1 ribosome biogenesis GTPase YlqF [Fictibacillus enclensis]MDM5198851.1 ribosome biogenesis GTPase YlqF [Fictibacillus enclensis]MDM5338053.1 ribosome biogenesis GTPase YlqF [Fictibacillus enclensis]RXY99289.1 ribosome biogenesis GTPase YlqF [Fictibacillus sp. S7]WHY74402.1 ribosome biogenesis GTPase YlqF [Fictibacillus enclensis]